MRIVGIDPSLKATGYGFLEVVDGKVKLLETGTIEPKQKDPMPKRIERIYSILDSLIVEYHPDILVLEKLYHHTEYPTTASILGHVRGVICLLCAQHGLTLVEHSVKRIRKALVGNGNATKEQTRRLVAQLLNIKETQLGLDTSDALALALGHAHMLRFKLI